jgi:tryptophanyl-tRNA synthetase
LLIDPWASSQVDYDKLVNQFGIKKFHDILNTIKEPSQLMRRGVIFGHRDFNKIVPLANQHKEFAVVTGMMPSGQMHIGHKMVVDQLKWYLDKGATLSIPIADMESYAARGISLEKAKEIAINEYLTNYIALGLDLTSDKINIYLQSQNNLLKDLTFKISKRSNFNEMKAIYGFTPSTNLAHIYAPLTQVADILIPQIPEHGGPKQVIVPVGVDQDPHIRLTRDIADKMNEEYGFLPPASTYHRFLTGLTGGKMSSSKPKTAIYLNDTPKEAEKKVKTAKTGGRESLQEQKELGGRPDECVIYEMLVYHLIESDEELSKIHEECKNGTLLCGACKARTSELMKEFFEDLHTKQPEAKEIAETIF